MREKDTRQGLNKRECKRVGKKVGKKELDCRKERNMRECRMG
jgi:hypothetical protein